MKLDFQIDKNEDLEHFKTLFFRNVGTDQMVYDFHMDDVIVRLQTSGIEQSQLISIGFFSVKKEKSTTTTEQFNPLHDDRFHRFEAITSIWGSNPSGMWASFSHGEDGTNEAFVTIVSLLLTVFKVNKLKAFL